MKVACFVVLSLSAIVSTSCRDKNGVAVGEASKSIQSPATEISADLVWTHVTEAFNKPQAWFIIRLTNSADSEVSGVSMNVEALDDTGTIVGSAKLSIPAIPANSDFDYFGKLGGTIFSELSGKPTQIKISHVSTGRSGTSKLLKTSELKLRESDKSFMTVNAAYAYDLSVRVTNDTSRSLSTSVHQQVILYNASGNPVGGGDGSSDNQPDMLDPGASYREEWTQIPAVSPAASARYSVWPER